MDHKKISDPSAGVLPKGNSKGGWRCQQAVRQLPVAEGLKESPLFAASKTLRALSDSPSHPSYAATQPRLTSQPRPPKKRPKTPKAKGSNNKRPQSEWKNTKFFEMIRHVGQKAFKGLGSRFVMVFHGFSCVFIFWRFFAVFCFIYLSMVPLSHLGCLSCWPSLAHSGR